MFQIIGTEVFPFLRTLGGDGSTYSEHIRDARFTIPTAALLSKVVDLLDGIDLLDTGIDVPEVVNLVFSRWSPPRQSSGR